MKVTIVNRTKEEKKYTRVELDEFVNQLKDGTYHHHYIRDFSKDVCFAAEWQKQNGELKAKAYNPLILLSLENLRDLTTASEYKQQAIQLPYTLLCFLGHDGHSIHIVCPYTVSDGAPSVIALQNAFRKLHVKQQNKLFCTARDAFLQSKRLSEREQNKLFCTNVG